MSSGMSSGSAPPEMTLELGGTTWVASGYSPAETRRRGVMGGHKSAKTKPLFSIRIEAALKVRAVGLLAGSGQRHGRSRPAGCEPSVCNCHRQKEFAWSRQGATSGDPRSILVDGFVRNRQTFLNKATSPIQPSERSPNPR